MKTETTSRKGLIKSRLGGGKREQSVDFIKGWAMLTIVIFHQSQSIFPEWIANLMMNPWNVAIFFVVAGYFLKWEKLVSPVPFIKGKLKSLYIPASLIYLCAVLLHNAFAHIGWYPIGELHPGSGVPFAEYSWKEILTGCLKVVLCAGSGELVMGAMWFLYTLIYAMVGLSILAWSIKRLVKNENTQQWIFFVLLLIAASGSCIATQKLGMTINRVNIAVTAMFLINVGRLFKQYAHLNYNNGWAAIACLIVFVHIFVLQHVGMTMANNSFQDLCWLTCGCLSLIYIYTYIARKIDGSFLMKGISLIGRESFYVMALHIVCLFCCNSLLIVCGVFGADSQKGMYTYSYGNHVGMLLLYTFCGVAFPLFVVYLKNRIKKIYYKTQDV